MKIDLKKKKVYNLAGLEDIRFKASYFSARTSINGKASSNPTLKC